MISLQLVNQLPYALEDVIVDHCEIEKGKSGYTRILVMVVHKETTGKYLKIFEKIGVSVSHFSANSIGVWGWWQYQLSSNKKLKDIMTMVINVDTASSELCFCAKDKLIFARCIDVGNNDLYGENYIEFLDQISMSLDLYTKASMGGAVEQVKILTNMPVATTLQSRVEEKIHLPAEIIRSTENLPVDSSVSIDQMSEKEGMSFAASSGLLLSSAVGRVINLTPSEVFQQKQTQKQTEELIRLLVSFCVVVLIVFSFFGLEVYRQRRDLNVIQKKQDEIRPLLKEQIKKDKLVDAVKDELAQRIFVPDVMVALYKLVPDDISLKSVSLDAKRHLVIQGYARGNRSVTVFQKSLVRATDFFDVNLQYSTKRRIYNMELRDFKLTASVQSSE